MECSSLLLVVSLIARIQLKVQMRNTIHNMGNTDAVSCTGDCTVRNCIVIPNTSLKVYFWSKNCAVQAQGCLAEWQPQESWQHVLQYYKKKSERRYDSSYCMLFETLSKYLIEIKTCLQILFERAKIKMKKADGWGQTQGERRL